MIPFVQALLGALVWLVANVVYIDMKRKGKRGFTRFAAFWAGTPTTWITFFALPEGKPPTFDPPSYDEEEALLEAIRLDRASRGLEPGSSEADHPEGDAGRVEDG
jgi:hypothetical protein